MAPEGLGGDEMQGKKRENRANENERPYPGLWKDASVTENYTGIAVVSATGKKRVKWDG